MQTIYPSLRYRDARSAIDWLSRAFGFERVAVHESDQGLINHAELRFGPSLIMLGAERPTDDGSGRGGHVGQSWIYVVVEDADAHHARAVEAGAEIVRELSDQSYGSRDYAARDPEGNLWSFGTYNPTAQ
jgi:uncharacterized glyoxalase superfamily protein PhnB